MVAYILWGDRIGLDFSRSGSFATLGQQLKRGLSGFTEGFGNKRPQSSTGTPSSERDSFERWRSQEQGKLLAEREELEKQKKAFRAEKNAFESRSKEES